MGAEPADRFATARATLRDNLKWMAGSLSAAATLIVGTTPFTGLGELPPGSPRSIVAAVALTIVGLGGLVALRMLITAVRPDTTYARFLRTRADLTSLPDDERREYEALRAEFQAHKDELLPDGVTTFEAFEQKWTEAWDEFRDQSDDPFAQQQWEGYNANLFAVQNWLSYTRLHRRVTTATNRLLLLGTLIIAALIVFEWAVNGKHSEERPPAVYVNQISRAEEPESFSHALFRSRMTKVPLRSRYPGISASTSCASSVSDSCHPR
jgi:hypothetical protein